MDEFVDESRGGDWVCLSLPLIYLKWSKLREVYEMDEKGGFV